MNSYFSKNLIIIAFILFLILSVFDVGDAAFNEQINYQGILTDTDDVAVDGSYNLKFSLCITSDCTDGSDPIWTETHCYSPDDGSTCDGTGDDQRVSITDGLFSVLLGSISTFLSSVNFNQTLWLEVQVGDSGTTPSWETLTPRKQLGAVPAAFEAKQLAGFTWESPGTLGFTTRNTGAFTTLSAAVSDSSTALTVTQSSTGNIADFIGDSITSGTGLSISADGLVTGTALDISSTSTAGGESGSSKLLNFSRSGVNENASHTAYGLYTVVTNTGTTSTNIAGYFSASGAINNYGLIVENGNVGIGDTSPDYKLEVLATTAQLALTYNDTNYTYFQVDDSGNLTITPSGGTTTFTGNIAAPTKGTASYIVAANDSPTAMKNIADYTCDGTTDDVQINAALAAVESDGGGTVFLAAGNYAISDTITIPSNTVLEGAGESTILTLDNGVQPDVGDESMITNSNTTPGSRDATGNSNITIRDMKIDGNKDGQGNGSDTQWCVGFSTVENLRIENLTVVNGWTAAIRTEFCSYVTIANNRVHNSGDDGIAVDEETYYAAVYGNRITDSGQGGKDYGSPNGIEIQDGAHDVSVTTNTIYNSVDGVQVSTHAGKSSCYNISISSNTIKSYSSDGISVLGINGDNQKAITVANNQIFNDSGSASYGLRGSYTEDVVFTGNTVRTDTYGGILSDTNTRTTISFNNFTNTDAADNDKKGFLFVGTYTDVRFEGNTVNNFGWKGLAIAGTATRMHVVNNNIIGCTHAVGACVRWDSPTSTSCILDGNDLQGTHWSRDEATSTYNVMAANWTVRTDDVLTIDRTNNYVGIGDTTPRFPLEILSVSTAQLALTYNDTNYTYFEVDNSGNLTISPSVNITDEANGYQIDGKSILWTGALANYNIFLGEGAFNNDEGQYNVGLGFQAGYYNTTGVGIEGKYNIYIGYVAGYGAGENNTGGENIGIGAQALYNITSGTRNVVLGYDAGLDNTSGSSNTFLGYRAGFTNTTGSDNLFIGSGAGYTNLSAADNIALGTNSLYTNSVGTTNLALGNYSLNKTTGSSNIAIGRSAGFENTSGGANIFIGAYAGTKTQAGSNNVIIGTYAGMSGSGTQNLWNNTFIGHEAGRLATTGIGNVFLGMRAGYNQTSLGSRLIIDNQNRYSAAAELTDSLIYGVFDADPANQTLTFNAKVGIGLVPTANMAGLSIEAGLLTLKETTTPTADVNYGKIYTKNDDKLYFQSGAGIEYELGGAASFRIPAHEVIDPISGELIEVGDFVLGTIDVSLDDGGLHGLWTKWDNVKKELLDEIFGALDEDGSIDNGDNEEPEITISEFFIQKVKQALAQFTPLDFNEIFSGLGFFIENGIAYIEEITAKKITIDFAKIKKAEIDELQVNKIQMVDQKTGDVYCTWIEYGETKKVRGECSTIEFSDSSGDNNQTGYGKDQTGYGEDQTGYGDQAWSTTKPEHET